MTEQEIKQKVEKCVEDFIADAHSMLEAMKELKEELKFADESIADVDKWITEYELDITNLEAKRDRLHNQLFKED